MKTIVLDVETSLREPWTETDAAGKPTFAPLPLHQIEIACWLVAENGGLELRWYNRGGLCSLGVLCSDLRKADRLVTWNGRGFDMPLLSLHALEAGLDFSWWEAKRHRYPNYNKALWHYDLQDQLSDYGAARGMGLDRVARLLGYGKQGGHGAEVFEMLAAGKRDEVLAYCCNDVLITYLVYLHWSASHGGEPAARSAADAALCWAAEHPVLSRFYGEEVA